MFVTKELIRLIDQDHDHDQAFFWTNFSTVLMTPTATVLFMSLTANLPRGGKLVKDSTHIGLVGFKVTIAQSPVLMNLGSFSSSAPDLLSILFWIFSNLQAI